MNTADQKLETILFNIPEGHVFDLTKDNMEQFATAVRTFFKNGEKIMTYTRSEETGIWIPEKQNPFYFFSATANEDEVDIYCSGDDSSIHNLVLDRLPKFAFVNGKALYFAQSTKKGAPFGVSPYGGRWQRLLMRKGEQ